MRYGIAVNSIHIGKRLSLVGDGKVDTLLHVETHTPGFGPVEYSEQILMKESLIFRCFDVSVYHAVICEKSDCWCNFISDIVDEQQEKNRPQH